MYCRPQHLSGLEVVRDLSQGKLEDACVGSQQIKFYPKEIQSGSYLADTKTAGYVLLCVLFPLWQLHVISISSV